MLRPYNGSFILEIAGWIEFQFNRRDGRVGRLLMRSSWMNVDLARVGVYDFGHLERRDLQIKEKSVGAKHSLEKVFK